MKSIGAAFLRPDALPGVNHMRVISIEIQNQFLMAHSTLTNIGYIGASQIMYTSSSGTVLRHTSVRMG